MDFLGIIYLLFMVANQATSYGTRVPTGIPMPHSNPSDLCPGSAQLSSIADRLVPNLSGVERLVIFVYRRLGTNELITFIPSAELQNCIQDYPESKDNEIYSINTVTIEALFTHSTNKIIRLKQETGSGIEDDQVNQDDRPWEIIVCPGCDNNPDTDVPTDITNHQNPTLLLPGVEQQNTTKEIHIIKETEIDKTTIDKIIFDWKGPDSSDSKPLEPGGSIDNIFFPISPPYSDNTGLVIEVDGIPGNVDEILPEILIPNYIDGVLQEPGQFQASVIPPADFIIHNNYPPPGPIEGAPLYEMPQTHKPSNVMYYPPLREWNVDGTEEITDGGSYSINTDRNYVALPTVTSINRLPQKPPLVQIFPSIPSTGEGHATNSQSQWQLLNVPIKELPNKHPNEYAWAIKFPNINFKHLNQGQQGTQPIRNIHKHAHLNQDKISRQNFDSWLLAQLNGLKINSGKEMPTSPADINIVKKEIEQALHVNGFRVTSEGLLVDANGVTSSLSNLKLRPLLIGKSFTYNSLLTGANGKYKRPATPLIEGLLLTLINPARVLGLVTLGVTAMPQNVHDGNKQVLFREWNLQSNKKELPKTVEKALLNFVLTSPLRTGEIVSSGRSMEIGTMAPPVLSAGNEPEGGEYVGDGEPEGPGFRIIGGSSATGTGTPLAIKGRSGNDE